nr:ATP-binding cassette sub-family G member 1 [Halyomorpha halys]
MEVSFQGLSYTSPLSRRRLINDVSGRFLPGQLTAILGPSGAGKTTLLNAISGYRRTGMSGKLSVGCRSCYIGQEDVLAPMISCGELMEFAAKLKLPPSYNFKQRAAVVEELLHTLNLEDCYDTRTEKLSGGQRRRLSIALELINNPPVLFLDEPTSGLDNVSAGQLIRLLNKLSRGGHTIVCTIHQPSASLFELFDRVYVMAQGKCIYQGGPGGHLLYFLANNGFVCPTHYSIADYGEYTIILHYARDPSCPTPNGLALTNGNKGEPQEEYDRVDCEDLLGVRVCASFWIQFTAILSRILLQARRNKVGLQIQFYHHLGCGLAMGLMFHDKAVDGTEFFNQMKFCMGVILFVTYTQLMVPILYYPFEVKLLKREHFNQWYRLFPYYAAFTVAKLPYMAILNILYLSLMYSLSGLPWEIGRFSLFCLIGIMTSLVAEAMGLTIGAIFSVTNGAAVGPMTMAPFFGLAQYGFDFARTMPTMMVHLVRTSFMRAGVVSVVLTVFGMDRDLLSCELDLDPCHFRDPKVVLHFLDLDKTPLITPLFDLFLSLCFFRLAFYLALKWRLRR